MTGDRDAFITAFFGEGNLINAEAARERPELATLVARLESDLRVPVVLPRRRDSERVDWYVLARDEEELRTVQEEVSGFIGPTYARWHGRRAALDRDDPVERAVAEFTDDHSLRLTTRDHSEFRRCWEAVQLMHRVWAQRPARRTIDQRTSEAILREFELALANDDATRAGTQIGELQRRGLVSADNIRFLEVRRLAAQGMWSTIVEHPDLRMLTRRRRPWLVSDALITAFWHTDLAPHADADGASAALSRIRHIVAEHPELYAARGPLKRAEVLKSFALRYAIDERFDVERIRRLLDEPDLDEADRDFIESVAGSALTPESVQDPVAAAREALAAGDLEGALRYVAELPATAASVAVMIECAFELGTLSTAQDALVAYRGLTQGDQGALRGRRVIARALDDLEGLVQPVDGGHVAPPSNWSEWLDRLVTDREWKSAEAVAICGELEFAADDLNGATDVAQLADLLVGAADSDRRQLVLDALPRLVRWLDRQPSDPSTLRPVYSAVLTVVALDSSWADSALELAYNMTEDLLIAGVDVDGYRDLLDQLELVWDRMAAQTSIPWLVDAFELLESHPGDRDRLLAFALSTVEVARPYVDRASALVRSSLTESLRRIGVTDVLPKPGGFPDEPPPDVVDALAGRIVGLYTLTPQVAVRARQGILRAFPAATVEHNDDHVATEALLQLARTAEVMIISVRSAKHAATDAITKARPPQSVTLFPPGRGSSRIVEALVEAVREGRVFAAV